VIFGKIVNIDGTTSEIKELYNIDTLPNLLDENDNIFPLDLRKYMFRQKTQELMFESIQFNKKIMIKYTYNDHIQIDIFKENLQLFFKKMRKYMRINNLMNDSFMKLLCDDIYVTFKTFGNNNSEMYVVSRHRGQSDQSTYRAGSQQLDDSYDKDSIKRKNSFYTQEEEYTNYENESILIPIDENDLNYFKPESIDDTLYSNENIQNTIRSVSSY
jgi:hypothetical protein